MIVGSMFTHNCISQDYCFVQAINSLLGVCELVVVLDAESTDGTKEEVAGIGSSIQLVHSRWNPVVHTGGKWLSELANEARSYLPQNAFHVCLQADEVLHPADYPEIRRLAKIGGQYLCRRFNFWKDGCHIVPAKRIVGHNIVRLGPSNVPFVADAENLDPKRGSQQSRVRIFHYGFLRKAEAQIAKGKQMEQNFFGTYNPIYDRMEQEKSRECYNNATDMTGELIPIWVNHPPSMEEWLKERCPA